ncbi:MAG: hypothetical protein ACTSPY_10145 [Candidatus Helarchaeota archaeon]
MSEDEKPKRKLRSFSIKKGGAQRASEKGKESILENLEDDD